MAGIDVERLRSIVQPLVEAAGFDLEDLVVTAAGKRRQVKVLIDSDDGVDMDAAAQVSRNIAADLDALTGRQDPMGELPYTLEVSSPGVGRPLTLPRHFRRAAGRLVLLRTTEGEPRQVRILQADDTTVTVLTGAASVQRESVPFEQVVRAGVEVEFSPPPAAVRAVLAEVGADRAAQDSRVDLTADAPGADDDLDEDADEDEDLDDDGDPADDVDTEDSDSENEDEN